MSDTRMDRDVEHALAAWMDAVAPDRPPSRLLEETFARTTAVRQARVFPWQRLDLGIRRPANGGRSARLGLVAVAGVLLAALLLGLGAGGGPSPTHSIPSPTPTIGPLPTEAARPLPSAGLLTPDAAIPLVNPGWPSFDGTQLLLFHGADLVSRVDPATAKVVGDQSIVLDPGSHIGGISANGAGAWVSSQDANFVYRLDPVTFAVIKKIPVGAAPGGVYLGDGAVWVANLHGGSVTRIDPATNKVVATIVLGEPGPGGPHAIAEGLGSIWVSAGSGPDGSGGDVVRIDPATNEIQARIPLPANASACGGFAIAADAVWMSSCFDQQTLVRIDPATNTV
ncbi:MAG TPA: hypothetical protein VHL56_08800, partial [Candidatus Limnocylindrales bacterium]|nr:hypothetical protein [Candidatus Limnocylindrales bacterium]